MVLRLAAGKNIPMILINPMYPPRKYLEELCPESKNNRVLDNVTFERLVWDLDKEQFENVFVILGRDDDIIDTKRTKDYFLKDRVFYLEGGHFLDAAALSEMIVKEYSFINDKKELRKEKFNYKADVASKAKKKLRKFMTGNLKGEKLYYFYTGKLTEERIEDILSFEQLIKDVLDELKENPHYKDLNMEFISLDELPAPDENLRSKFKNTDVLVINNVRKDLITPDIQRALYIVLSEMRSHGGRVILIADDYPYEVFEKDASLLDLIYSGNAWYYDDFGDRSHGGSFHGSRKGYFRSWIRPRKDLYTGIDVKDVNLDNGSFKINYSSDYHKDGLLYMYFDGKNGTSATRTAIPLIPRRRRRCLKLRQKALPR